MKVSELQEIFLNQLKSELTDWKFVKKNRSFKKKTGDTRFHFHITCIKHIDDFDATADVAVEFMQGNKCICIIGAQLSNIDGTGQKRFHVGSSDQAKSSAKEIYKYFIDVGAPFLERFKDPNEVLSVLRAGGNEAILISPIKNLHQQEIESLEKYTKEYVTQQSR